MSLVCLDNHVLIWGIKEQPTDGQEEMVSRTKAFIESLNNDETIVLIPSVVIAEFLMPVPSEFHAMVINLFNKNFIIAPFDALAASKFSLIWNAYKPPDEAKELIDNQATRAELKADSMIVATAIARKADYIVSHDTWLKTIAKNFIEVKEIPFIPEQAKQFPRGKDEPNWGSKPKGFNEQT